MPATDRLCPACGYPETGRPCPRCSGTVSNRVGKTVRPGPGFPIADLIEGFLSLFLGALELFHRREFVGKLWLPVTLNLVVLVATFLLLTLPMMAWFDGLIGADDWGWWEWLHAPTRWFSWAVSVALAAVVTFLVAPILIETVMGPFLEPIAAATERAYSGNQMPAIDRGFVNSMWIGVRASAQILVIQLLLLVPLLLITLTGIGAIVAFVITGWLNALVWFDIPCARRGLGLRERHHLLRRNWARALGFGLAFQVGLFIPFFNFLLLTPAAAVATSALFFRFDKSLPEHLRGDRVGSSPRSFDA